MGSEPFKHCRASASDRMVLAACPTPVGKSCLLCPRLQVPPALADPSLVPTVPAQVALCPPRWGDGQVHCSCSGYWPWMLGKQVFPSPPEPAALGGTFKSYSTLLFSLCFFLVLCCTSLHSPTLIQTTDRAPLRQGEQHYTTAAKRQQDEVHRVKAFSIPPPSLPSLQKQTVWFPAHSPLLCSPLSKARASTSLRAFPPLQGSR